MTIQQTLERWTAEVAAETDLVAEIASAEVITEALVERLARAVIVDLRRFLLPNMKLVEPAKAWLERAPESLAVVQLVNVLTCSGLDLHRVPIDLRRVKTDDRTQLALIAISLGDVELAARSLGGRGPYRPYARYEHDLRGAIGHWIDVDQQPYGNPDKRADASAAWLSIIDRAEVDAAALLAIARLIEHRWGKQRVGVLAHHVRQLFDERAAAAPVPPDPPPPRLDTFPGATLLYGGSQQMWRDADRLISVNSYTPADDREKLPQLLAYGQAGVLELESISHALDWTLIERLPAGVTWLPDALAQRDDFRSRALDFGISAGRILLDAANHGVVLGRVRPELMWCRGRDVVAVSDRTARLFELRRTSFFVETFPLSYRAPEGGDDIRALTFSLAACVAEWATGRHPFPRAPAESKQDAVKRPHVTFGLDAKLEAVLDEGLQADPAKRTKLADFVRKLDKLR